MSETELYNLRFPIGEWVIPIQYEQSQIAEWIRDIELFPTSLKELTQGLNGAEKNWKYRPDGWSLKQVVHHCADSHLNGFIRTKFALTEDAPTIKVYKEDKWAELVDGLDDDLSHSLTLLHSLHSKWAHLLKSLDAEQLQTFFIHPETESKMVMPQIISLYAWHGNHHLEHIKLALNSKGKYN